MVASNAKRDDRPPADGGDPPFDDGNGGPGAGAYYFLEGLADANGPYPRGSVAFRLEELERRGWLADKNANDPSFVSSNEIDPNDDPRYKWVIPAEGDKPSIELNVTKVIRIPYSYMRNGVKVETHLCIVYEGPGAE